MDWGCEWRHARKRWAGILGFFEKKAVSWDLDLDESSCLLRDARAFVGLVSWELTLDEQSA